MHHCFNAQATKMRFFLSNMGQPGATKHLLIIMKDPVKGWTRYVGLDMRNEFKIC